MNDGIYFDPAQGWVAPTIQHKETLAKYVNEIRANNGLPESLFDAVEAVIREYCGYEEYDGDKRKGGYRPSIRHGENVFIGNEPISWHFNPIFSDSEHVTICFKQSREWVDDCYIDQLPVDFLLFILKRIKNRRPLQDQQPATIERDAAAYVAAADAEKAKRELEKQLRFKDGSEHVYW